MSVSVSLYSWVKRVITLWEHFEPSAGLCFGGEGVLQLPELVFGSHRVGTSRRCIVFNVVQVSLKNTHVL